jgi:hypothetical protein
MDALTSFELEAQRRRETIVIDRANAWSRVKASTEPVEADRAPWAIRGSRHGWEGQADCQPAPLARQSAG